MATKFRLREGVNRVRVGSIVVDEKGFAAVDALEEQLLDSHPDLLRGNAKATRKQRAPKAAPVTPKAAPVTPSAEADEGASS